MILLINYNIKRKNIVIEGNLVSPWLPVVLTSWYHLDIGRLCVTANQFRWTSKSVERLREQAA